MSRRKKAPKERSFLVDLVDLPVPQPTELRLVLVWKEKRYNEDQTHVEGPLSWAEAHERRASSSSSAASDGSGSAWPGGGSSPSATGTHVSIQE